jgi:hypothetical protein
MAITVRQQYLNDLAMERGDDPPFPERDRPCTCHPDDNPPIPCAHKYALTDCRAALQAAKDTLVDLDKRLRGCGNIWTDDAYDSFYQSNVSDALKEIVAALSAVPAPLSEEEIAREPFLTFSPATSECNALIEPNRGNEVAFTVRGAGTIKKQNEIAKLICDAVNARLSPQWRPDPRTVEECAKVAETLRTMDVKGKYPTDHGTRIAAAIRSLNSQTSALEIDEAKKAAKLSLEK